jgi:hypothetical protein
MKTENLIKQALDALDQYQLRRYPQHLFDARMALYKALETIYKVEDPLGDIQYLKDPFHDSQYLTNKKGL